MSVTYSNVPISAITDLQDYLINSGALYIEPCRVEVKLYRANQASFGEEGKSKSMFTIWLSHDPERMWSFGPQNKGILATPVLKQIIESKLQSLWVLRQTFKGEGRAYQLEDGSHIRLSNILVQGNYKGLLIDADATPICQELLKNITEKFGLEPSPGQLATSDVARVKMYQKVYQ